jgi:hypothetical protein
MGHQDQADTDQEHRTKRPLHREHRQQAALVRSTLIPSGPRLRIKPVWRLRR